MNEKGTISYDYSAYISISGEEKEEEEEKKMMMIEEDN